MSLSLRKPQPILWITPIVLLLIAAKPQTQKIVAQSATVTQKAVAQVAQEVKQVIDIWEGDGDSLVAIAVGSAEGTRRPDGGKNSAYQGHPDPANGVWNRGSFSYQHC